MRRRRRSPITELVLKDYLTPMQMAEKIELAIRQRVLGLDAGSLEEGKPADIVIFDAKKGALRFDKNEFWSKGRNTPFDGREVTGAVLTEPLWKARSLTISRWITRSQNKLKTEYNHDKSISRKNQTDQSTDRSRT